MVPFCTRFCRFWEQKLVADFFNKLVFAHTALIEILGQQRLAELAVCIVEARVVHDNA